MRFLAAVMALGAVCSGMAQAQSVDCDNAMTQLDMNTCAVLAFEAADADLNAAYAKARAAMRQLDADLDAGQRGAEVALRDAQRAWIPYRDNACITEGFHMRGGSAEPLLIFDCKARLTGARAEDLWALAAGMEG